MQCWVNNNMRKSVVMYVSSQSANPLAKDWQKEARRTQPCEHGRTTTTTGIPVSDRTIRNKQLFNRKDVCLSVAYIPFE